MDGIQKVLTSLSYGEEEVEVSVSDLANLLYRISAGGEEGAALRDESFSRGIVKSLLGILRSSSRVTLLAKTAGCIALLAHDSDDVRAQLTSTDVISLLLALCTPRPNSDLFEPEEPAWHREWVPVYEQVLIALRKLTYLNLDHQHKLAQIGGVKLIVDLCTDKEFLQMCSQFSPEAKSLLEEYTLGKKLICRTICAADNERKWILKHFPVASQTSPTLSLHYPVYLVQLATREQTWIENMMVASGTVWPDTTTFPESSNPVWTCVMVSCVNDGGHVWCQFCSERPRPKVQAMCASLLELPAPPLPAHSELVHSVGDVYAAFCGPSPSPSSPSPSPSSPSPSPSSPSPSLSSPSPSSPSAGCLAVSQWCRARLLQVEKSGELCVFALDFGFTATVPKSHVCPLPPQCRGVPPQAVPCKLLGVAAVPTSVAMLENGAAVLRNMAFEKYAYRYEILNFGGIEALMKLSQCPDRSTVEQSIGALLNLAVSDELREEMGKRGTVKMMMALCELHSSDEELLRLSLGCLQNMLVMCPANVTRLSKLKGHARLTSMLESKHHNHRIEKCILGVLCHLPIPQLTRPGQGEAKQGFSLSCRQGNSPRQPVSHERKKLLTSEKYKERRRVNGERLLPNPIHRCLEPEEEGVWHFKEERERGEAMAQNCEPSGSISHSKYYMVGSKLPYESDETHELIDVLSVNHIRKGRLKRSICAMVNTAKASTVYIGVRNTGAVVGIRIDRKERDILTVDIDNLMRDFQPCIKHDRYKVLYIPVAYSIKEGSPRIAEGYYVVQLELHGSLVHQIHTIGEPGKSGELFERCYYRAGKSNEAILFQELRNIIAFEETKKYSEVVTSMERQIADMKEAIKLLNTTET